MAADGPIAGLLGPAAIAIWLDYPPEHAPEHDAWHSGEHFPERLGIPGFLRGRRAVAREPGIPRYFVMYEIEGIGTAVSAPYLERLDAPTDWTRRVMAGVLSMRRALCKVTATCGAGVGADVVTLRLAPAPDHRGELRERLARQLLPELAARRGLVGAHLLERDDSIGRPATGEERLRGRPDATADWVIVLEGYDGEALREAGTALAQETAGGPEIGAYRLAHVVSRRS
jgi:hypothetical protein